MHTQKCTSIHAHKGILIHNSPDNSYTGLANPFVAASHPVLQSNHCLTCPLIVWFVELVCPHCLY